MKELSIEDKELLLKDLCSRLPYYPKCEMIDELRVVNHEKDSSYISTLFPKHIELLSYHNNFTIKPFLRPMSSMTKEEEKEYNSFIIGQQPLDSDFSAYPIEHKLLYEFDVNSYIDWLNAHQFDYRGLIPKGLANEMNYTTWISWFKK